MRPPSAQAKAAVRAMLSPSDSARYSKRLQAAQSRRGAPGRPRWILGGHAVHIPGLCACRCYALHQVYSYQEWHSLHSTRTRYCCCRCTNRQATAQGVHGVICHWTPYGRCQSVSLEVTNTASAAYAGDVAPSPLVAFSQHLLLGALAHIKHYQCKKAYHLLEESLGNYKS